MLTTKDIMESCWEADSNYSDVVLECKTLGLRIPTEDEYRAHCAAANDVIQDWYDSNGRYDEHGALDAGGHFYAERVNIFEDD